MILTNAKNLSTAKYGFLINKSEDAGKKYLNGSKVFKYNG